MKTQQEVEQIFKGSGLFKKVRHSDFCHKCKSKDSYVLPDPNICVVCESKTNWDDLPYPTADQSEEILGIMELEVVFNSPTYILASDEYIEGFDGIEGGFEGLPWAEVFKGIKRGERTLANNAALAWCCPNMKEELEQAINSKKDK